MIAHLNLTGVKTLLAVTFGGLIAQEIVALIPIHTIVLISSLTDACQING